MIRIVLVTLALAAVPFIVYGIYDFIRQGADGNGPRNPKEWEAKALIRLGFAGLILAALGVAAVIITSSPAGEGIYVPAHLENGKLIDGGFYMPDELPKGTQSAE